VGSRQNVNPKKDLRLPFCSLRSRAHPPFGGFGSLVRFFWASKRTEEGFSLTSSAKPNEQSKRRAKNEQESIDQKLA